MNKKNSYLEILRKEEKKEKRFEREGGRDRDSRLFKRTWVSPIQREPVHILIPTLKYEIHFSRRGEWVAHSRAPYA